MSQVFSYFLKSRQKGQSLCSENTFETMGRHDIRKLKDNKEAFQLKKFYSNTFGL